MKHLFLIIDEYSTDFCQKLRSVSIRKGLDTLLLTAQMIACEISVDFYLNDHTAEFKLCAGDFTMNSRDISGVYCGLNAFTPKLWDFFSPEDAEYAARESQALWLALLTSLGRRVVNLPTPDSLAGTSLSVFEFYNQARKLGFHIPMVLILESGEAALELSKTGAVAFYQDLGRPWPEEKILADYCREGIVEPGNHIRIREYISGRKVCITLLGQHIFASIVEPGEAAGTPMGFKEIPLSIRNCLLALHKGLNLNMAEYLFKLTDDGEWIITGIEKHPYFTFSVFGNCFLESLVEFVTGEKG